MPKNLATLPKEKKKITDGKWTHEAYAWQQCYQRNEN